MVKSTQLHHPLVKLFENKWLQHLLFWLIYLTPTSYYLLTICGWRHGIIPLIGTIVLDLSTVYFNLSILVPRFLLKERYITYAINLLILLLVFCGLYTYWHLITIEYFMKVTDHNLAYSKLYFGNIFELAILLTLTTTFKISKNWFKQQQINRELLTEKLKAEIRFLRGQMNSHLLFNTLNNLYGLALKKSEKTPEAILKLSNMMEYMLYESDKKFIELSKEINHMMSYVEIEKLRLQQGTDIQIDVNGDLSSYKIAPFLLIPFVENAFKHHGTLGGQNPFIHIRIKVNKGLLTFKSINSKSEPYEGSENAIGGVGISNVKKRLNLIYSDRHQLSIKDDAHTYEINLNLILE